MADEVVTNASASGVASTSDWGSSWTVATNPVENLDPELELTGSQPYYAFVEVAVGGVVLTDFEDSLSDTLIDFNYTRKSYYTDRTQTGSKFSLSLYDDSAIEIEEAIVSNLSQGFTIKYGYAINGSERYATRELHGIAEKYGLAFEGASVTLTIDGSISTVDEMAGSVLTETYDAETYEGKPSEIVEKICNDEGWEIGKIEETLPVLNDDGSIRTFNRMSERATTFIFSMTEESVSAETGSSPYRFFVGEDGKVYFVSIDDINVPSEASRELSDEVLGVSTVNSSESNNGASTYSRTSRSNDVYTYENSDKPTGGDGFDIVSSNPDVGRYWVGDSRFNGMSSLASDGDVFIAEDSMGYDWLITTAIPELEGSLENIAGETVILGLGVNDLYNVDKYIEAYKSLMEEYPNVKFVVTSVTPVDDSKSIYAKNSDIEEFNNKLKEAFPDNYVDIYSQIEDSVDSSSTDSEGLHYNNDLKREIYNIISDESSGEYYEGSSNVNSSTSSTSNGSGSGGVSESSGSVRPVTITRRYEFYSGKTNNTVISFTPEYQGIAVSMLSNASSASVDAARNEMMSCSLDGSSVGKLSSDVAKKIMGLSSSSLDNLRQKSISMWRYYSTMTYGATLEILGDPTIKVGTYIYVTVYTKYGYIHHTSGIYYIKQAEDNISGGSFTTTLTLLKAGSSMDNVKAYVEGDSGTGGSSTGGGTQGNTGTGGSSNTGSGGSSSGNTGNNGGNNSIGGSSGNESVDNAVRWALGIANDDSHGYSLGASHGSEQNEYDCSSFVSWAYKHSGVDVPVSSTRDMRINFTNNGFTWIPGNPSVDSLQVGDIVLSEGHHVEMYIGNGQFVGASDNYDGTTGDSGGNEIRVTNYYGTWDGVLRYGG